MSFFAGARVSALNRTRVPKMTGALPARPISKTAGAFEMTTVSTIGMSATGVEPAAAILSPAEAAAAIRGLTAADKIALLKIARLYARKTPYDHEDLLQEAMCRVLQGARAWPDRKSTRLNSSHVALSRMPSSA